MLTLDQLQSHYRWYHDTPMLTVYLDADQRDFGERERWRVVLANGIRAAAEHLSTAEGRLLAAARTHLNESLAPDPNGFLRGRGWVGFATAEKVIHAEDLPVRMSNLVRWGRGPRIAPYLQVLERARPVVGVFVDARRARIVRYRAGSFDDIDRLQADTILGDLTDVSSSKRAVEATGRRGLTGTDQAQTYLAVERDRLMSRVRDEVHAAAGDHGLVVMGGTPEAVASLGRSLEEGLESTRRWERPELSLDLTDAELRDALDRAGAEWAETRQARTTDLLIDAAGSGGDACLGETAVARALRERRVGLLVFTDGYRREHGDRTDVLVVEALAQQAECLEVTGPAANRLATAGGGVGARLRFRVEGG